MYCHMQLQQGTFGLQEWDRAFRAAARLEAAQQQALAAHQLLTLDTFYLDIKLCLTCSCAAGHKKLCFGLQKQGRPPAAAKLQGVQQQQWTLGTWLLPTPRLNFCKNVLRTDTSCRCRP